MRSFLRRVAVPLWVAALGVALLAQTPKPPSPQIQPLPQTPLVARTNTVLPTASLSGRVTTAPSGRPLARARVVLTSDEIFECPPNNPEGRTDNCQRYNRVEITDTDGRYTITKLPKGKTFTVSVSKTGYATRAFGEVPPSTPATLIELKDEEQRTGVDVALAAQHVLTGILLDEDNTPLGGALVEAIASADLDGQRDLIAVSQSVTDERGRYRLFGLAPGEYVIRTTDPAFIHAGDEVGMLTYGTTFAPGTTAPRDSVRITVGTEPSQEVPTFALHIAPPIRPPVRAVAPPAPIVPTPVPTPAGKGKPGPPAAVPVMVPPTASLSGRLTSIVDGRPISRARVVVTADEIMECPATVPVGQTDSCPRYNRVALTDKDGRYTVDKLPRGKTFTVTALKTGYAARAFGETPPAIAPSFVVLKDGEKKDGIDVQLVPHNFASGMLVDTDETPFAGALIEALRAVYNDKGERSFVTAAESVTDDRGEFHLHGLAPGQYFITAFDPSFARVGDQLGQLFYGPTFYPGTVYQDDAVRVTLDPGVPVRGLKFKLQIIRPARLTGQISAPGLQLLSGAVNLGPSRSSRSASFAISEADIRPDGVFQFANILAERYIIRARAAVQVGGVSHFAIWTQPVSGADVTDMKMVLSPGARLEGIVNWESKTSRPPVDQSDVRIRAPMSDGSTLGDVQSGEIDTSRHFSLMGAMAGLHYIRVENLPEPWRLKKVTIRGSDVTDIPKDMDYNEIIDGIEITLTDVFTTLTGTAVLETGDLAQGYAVIAFPTNRLKWQPTSRYIKLTYLDDRGRYAFRGLPPAEYFVAVTRAADQSDLYSEALLDRLSRDAPTIRLGDGDKRILPLRALMPKR